MHGVMNISQTKTTASYHSMQGGCQLSSQYSTSQCMLFYLLNCDKGHCSLSFFNEVITFK